MRIPEFMAEPGLFNLLGGWAKRPFYFTEPQNFGISKNMSRAFLPQFMTLVSKATSWSHVIEECGEPLKNRFWSFPLQFYKGRNPNFFMLWDTANPRPLFPTAMGVLYSEKCHYICSNSKHKKVSIFATTREWREQIAENSFYYSGDPQWPPIMIWP